MVNPTSVQYSHRTLYWLCILVFIPAVLLVNACATPIVKTRLPVDLPVHWQGTSDVERLPITHSLLDLMDDPRLERLVIEALQNNPNIHATALRLKASGYLLSGTRSRQWPSVGAGFDVARDNQSIEVSTGNRTIESRHRANLQISWELDLWGRLADLHAAASLDYDAQANLFIRARDSLAARVVQTALIVIATQQTVELEKDRLTSLKNIELTLVRRFRRGLGTLDELSTARTRTQGALADLSSIKEDHQRALRTLETLLGRYPQGKLSLSYELPAIMPPPATIPASVLEKRPDVQAALNRVRSAEKTAGAAKKALLPAIGISSNALKESVALNSLSGTTTAWNVLASLTQPIFAGGRLKDEAKARSAEMEASLAELYETILQALKEVEDAFGREMDLLKQQTSLVSASAESEKSRRYFERRYKDGLDNILSLLTAREQEMTIKRRLLEVRAARVSNRVDLALALGFGVQDNDISTGIQ